MSTDIDFRGHVADCVRMAEEAQTLRQKALLLDLAQAWVLLAEQANWVGASKPLQPSEAAGFSNYSPDAVDL